MVEREIKLEIRNDFRMPDLSGVATGVVVAAGEPEDIVLDATYYDAYDLRLLRRASRSATAATAAGRSSSPPVTAGP